jgi:transcriptional regulator with XRE-family HTH domain
VEKYNYLSPILFDLGKHIKLIRQLKSMTQTQLAHNCSMEKSTISKIEAGRVNVGYLSLDRISRGLGVSVCDLSEDKTQIGKK